MHKAALQALKRKKRLEQQLTPTDGTLSTTEFQREALENGLTNTEVLKNMGFAAKAIKGVHQNMDLDKIDSLMQDITEQQALAQEDELLAELESSMKSRGRLPSVPTSKLPSTHPSHRSSSKKKVEDDDDMHMLAAWAT
ncbi:charged multivesicular body protein 4c-like [Centroberyx affinis]|uniref:charged multivesicular body protein 4c-like n=1 Tax=Centroberyx affinis TaxID=166261 RepID=UPI003A5B9909